MFRKSLTAAGLLLLAACVEGCATFGGGTVVGDVPECERLIPDTLLAETPPADLPVSAKLEDGHDDARPWQAGFIEQTGQLEVANTKPPAVDHIYRWCLRLAREQRERSKRGFFRRLFGG
jgi:hypothetical protein